jgi:hypothetical protein
MIGSRRVLRDVNSMSDENGSSGFLGFFKTLPGLLTAVAALITALATAGLIANRNDQPDPPPPATNSTAPAPAPTTDPADVAAFEVQAPLRTQAGQISEEMRLLFDGVEVASWFLQLGSNELEVVDLQQDAGRIQYEFVGTYTSNVGQFPARGEGTIEVADNAVYEVQWFPANDRFQLVRIG